MVEQIEDQSFKIFQVVREIGDYFFDAEFELESASELSEIYPHISQEELNKLEHITLSVRNLQSKEQLDHLANTVVTLAKKYQREEYWHEYVKTHAGIQINAFDISDLFERYIFYSAENPVLQQPNEELMTYYKNKADFLRQIKHIIISEI